MFYLCFISSSKKHIDWLRSKLHNLLKVKGHITHDSGKVAYYLKYAKTESIKIIKNIYPFKRIICLERKRLKIKRALAILGARL